MKRYFSGYDWTILLTILLLLFLSIVVVGSVAPNLFKQYLIYAFLGLLAFFLTSQIDYRIFEKLAFLAYIISIISLSFPLILGTITRGSLRWIQLGPLTIQPSEFAKPFLVIFFAFLFKDKEKITAKDLLRALGLLLVPGLLIFFQPDLGSSLIVTFSVLGIIFASGVSRRFILAFFIFFAVLSPLLWQVLAPYQQDRVRTFFNPTGDPLGNGYNVIQSTVAVGSGQITGRGLGKGTQSHLNFLPERHTDFIFSSLAEELGLLGALILIVLLSILFWRLLGVAKLSKEHFGFLVTIGIFTGLFSQTFINIGMNLGIMPITGITLPLVSYGGSSLLATMVSFGIVENIACLRKKEHPIEIR